MLLSSAWGGSGAEMGLFPKAVSMATSVCFHSLSCVASVTCILVSTVYGESLLIEIEMAVMKPAIIN